MKIFKTFVAALLLAMPVASNAMVTGTAAYEESKADVPTHFILCLNDGAQITFLLEHSPKVVNGDGVITVVDKDVTIEYPFEAVHKYLMGVEGSTGIDNVSVSKDIAVGEFDNQAGNVILSGFGAAVPVTVTDINGMVVYKASTDADGYLVIAMSQQPSGIYIVKVQNRTFKFIKR